ncbi:tRNA1(Val) (adenine(37)-N6)-methyltransferase [Psychroflexus sediminis]|uniref:tRNA1(Val) (adenine(37)-N6)-methyltransferase n=1 Tax=Psychroflexus sediminis TaxID=470826 RepID=A0A1G7UUD1_9FLAO|nr:methyltransferase [Psychroflexus sediminis]SDG51143.1 tRNA1Val (adenine37-N6)-methyltransferase [Psychroflexus sediminis]
MSDQVFRFKEFEVEHSRSAMKIGTDAVLLGAWVDIDENVSSILDVGAGTGILALQLAQRSPAETIDAVEIDPDAFEECVTNFENSPWGDRLFCYHASFTEFYSEMDEKYDLIVSNPPYFSEQPRFDVQNTAREQARFQEHLTFEDLLLGVSLLLSEQGQFSVVLPFSEQEKFISVAREYQLYPSDILEVRGQPASPIKRTLLKFRRHKTESIAKEELIIEHSRHEYTQEYIDLVKDFYLKM